MRILITGGAGCLGSNLIEHWLPKGHEIFVLDNFATGKREVVPEVAGLTVKEGSVADGALVRGHEARRGIVLPDLARQRHAAGGTLQAGQRPQHRRLAAARGADQRGDAGGRRLERRIERKPPELAREAGADEARRHEPTRAARLPSRIVASTTTKEKTTMPAARMLASRQREVST